MTAGAWELGEINEPGWYFILEKYVGTGPWYKSIILVKDSRFYCGDKGFEYTALGSEVTLCTNEMDPNTYHKKLYYPFPPPDIEVVDD